MLMYGCVYTRHVCLPTERNTRTAGQEMHDEDADVVGSRVDSALSTTAKKIRLRAVHNKSVVLLLLCSLRSEGF